MLSSLRSVDAGSVRAVPKDWAVVLSEPEMVEAGVRGARNSPAEQSDEQSDRVAPDIRADEWTDGIRGVVAQLGEHLHGMQGVGGSSPPSSTTFSSVKLRWYREDVSPFVQSRRRGLLLPEGLR